MNWARHRRNARDLARHGATGVRVQRTMVGGCIVAQTYCRAWIDGREGNVVRTLWGVRQQAIRDWARYSEAHGTPQVLPPPAVQELHDQHDQNR